MSLTLKMLHNFVEIVTEMEETVTEPLRRVDKDKDKEEDGSPSAHPTDIEFITSLKNNVAYKHIDVDTELAKMDAWLLVHKGRQKTRKFIVAWLNKIDKPFQSEPQPQPKSEPPLKFNPEEHAKVSKLIHETVEKMKSK